MPFRHSHPAPPAAAVFLLLALALLALAVRPAQGSWSRDSSAHLAVSNATGIHTMHRSASDGAGGVFLVWYRLVSSDYDVYAHHVLADGRLDPAWPADGVPVVVQPGVQYSGNIVADGNGGAYVVWYGWIDATSYDLFASHVLASGVLDPAWPAGGAPLSEAVGSQTGPQVAKDGAGGAYVIWEDDRSGTVNKDVYAHHLLPTGPDPGWPVNGLAVCTAANAQTAPLAIADGAGAAIVTWYDGRGTNSDIYAQKLLATGVPAWAADGVPVCAASGNQFWPWPLADGAGGAFVFWTDWRGGATTNYDVYAQHLRANGTLDPAWVATGSPVIVRTGDQAGARAIIDGAGGLLVMWQDSFSGNNDIVALRLLSTGVVDPAWSAAYPNGFPVCSATGNQGSVTLVPDGEGGALAAWADSRSGNNDLYARRIGPSLPPSADWPATGVAVCVAPGNQAAMFAQPAAGGDAIVTWDDGATPQRVRVARVSKAFARLGSSVPEIVAVSDVPGDQGGHVRVFWEGCAGDAPGLNALESYRLWRRALVAGAQTWEFIAEIPSRGVSGYGYMVETAHDSTYSSLPWNVFVVRALDRDGITEYVSLPDSGYSVDDLSPGAPAQFEGEFAGGVTALRWLANVEPDVVAYRLYAGDAADFAPAPDNCIALVAGTSCTDASARPRYYRLSAVDARGNQGPFARLDPAQVTQVPVAQAASLGCSNARPNPVRDACTFTLSLPRAGPVAAAVYDAGGRLVRVLLDGRAGAGEQILGWDGRDARGARVPNGLYFVRLRTADAQLVRRLAILR